MTDLIDALNACPTEQVPIAAIRKHEAFTPRAERLVPFRDQTREKNQSDEHIAALTLALGVSQDVQLCPVSLVQCPGSDEHRVPAGLYLLDGHHRLAAYYRAGRSSIPARVCTMTYEAAVLASKVANCSHRALVMHPSQKRDAAWQYLALVTHRGAIELPEGNSLRKVAGRFGISKNTVASMLKALPSVDVSEFHDKALDPGTGFPRWRCVCQSKTPWAATLASMSEQQLLERQAEKLAKALVELRNAYSHPEMALAFEMLKAQDAIEEREPGERAIDLLFEVGRPVGLNIDFLLSQLGQPMAAGVPEQLG